MGVCTGCGGSGYSACVECGGSGTYTTSDGNGSESTWDCPRCDRSGVDVCPWCSGAGWACHICVAWMQEDARQRSQANRLAGCVVALVILAQIAFFVLTLIRALVAVAHE